jgi:hypothetical protein
MKTSVPVPGSRQWYLDPSPWFSAMRHSAPVYYDQQSEVWHVFGYSDVELVLKQFSVFSSQFGGYDLASEREARRGRKEAERQSQSAGSGGILSSMLTTDRLFIRNCETWFRNHSRLPQSLRSNRG